MAELTIRLVVDPDTGKKNITIAYHSDEDAMPMEHEDEHRRLVNLLIEKGLLAAGELGEIVIEREESRQQAVPQREEEPMVERRSLAHET